MAVTQPVGPPDGVAVAGLVVGIVAIFVAWAPLGAVVTLSSLGLTKARRLGSESGLSIAGLGCSLLVFVLTIDLTLVIC